MKQMKIEGSVRHLGDVEPGEPVELLPLLRVAGGWHAEYGSSRDCFAQGLPRMFRDVDEEAGEKGKDIIHMIH